MIIIGAFSSKKEVQAYAKELEKQGHPSFIIEQKKDGTVETNGIKTTKELANEVMDKGLNGQARKDYLGHRFKEVQDYINRKYS